MTASDSWVSFRPLLKLTLGLLAIMTFSFLIHLRSRFPTPNATERGMWTVNSIGRLGNQMGEYATLYALAKMNGRQAYILPEMHQQLAPLFRITLPVLSRFGAWSILWRHYGLHDWMSEEYRHIKGKYVWLTGTPCSWTFYHHLRQEILQEFSFHNHVKEEANRYLAGLRGQRRNVTYVGVHVRRGDYVRVMTKKWKGVVADKAYLEKAMGYFRAKYQEPVFVVTSNGMEWCRENIDASRGDVYFSGDGKESSPGRDFALLAHCNHTIMTIGTFGIWAGYLAGGGDHLLGQLHPPRLSLPPGLQALGRLPARVDRDRRRSLPAAQWDDWLKELSQWPQAANRIHPPGLGWLVEDWAPGTPG